MTAADFDMPPIPEGGSWLATLPGFPPGADVAFTVNGGFDTSPHLALIPDSINVALTIDGSQMAIWIDGTFPSFPVWESYQSHAAAGPDGSLQLTLQMSICHLLPTTMSVCSIAPDSTFSATLIDTSPWLQAPPCGQ